jgi:hypothetical protein
MPKIKFNPIKLRIWGEQVPPEKVNFKWPTWEMLDEFKNSKISYTERKHRNESKQPEKLRGWNIGRREENKRLAGQDSRE